MREVIVTGKTVEDAVLAGCQELGVSRDDLALSYEVLEMPVKKLFKSIPAKVKVMLEEEEKPAPAPVVEKAPEKKEEPAAPAVQQAAAHELPHRLQVQVIVARDALQGDAQPAHRRLGGDARGVGGQVHIIARQVHGQGDGKRLAIEQLVIELVVVVVGIAHVDELVQSLAAGVEHGCEVEMLLHPIIFILLTLCTIAMFVVIPAIAYMWRV